MLVQLPRGSSDRSGSQNADSGDAFEMALRRDLATAPVISYDAVLGGWSKRAVDLALTILSVPLWLPLMGVTAAIVKSRHPAPVFLSHERIGYGGRAFQCYELRIAAPSATIEPLRPTSDGSAAAPDIGAAAESRGAKWLRALSRLPRMLNVLRGDMSLVGPQPLAREELSAFRASKRYYLSARPGVVGVNALADADQEEAIQYKMYALSWSHGVDALILWDALRSLRDRGELWRPSFRLRALGRRAVEATQRRRQGAA